MSSQVENNNQVLHRWQAANGFNDCISNNKGKIALGVIGVLALTGLGLAFGLHATRPAMLHFFGKMVPQAYLHGKIAPLVTATVGGVALGAIGVGTVLKCRQAKPGDRRLNLPNKLDDEPVIVEDPQGRRSSKDLDKEIPKED